MPGRTHEMKTISLKPLLFGKCTLVFGCGLLVKFNLVSTENTFISSIQSHTNIEMGYLLKLHRYVHLLLSIFYFFDNQDVVLALYKIL